MMKSVRIFFVVFATLMFNIGTLAQANQCVVVSMIGDDCDVEPVFYSQTNTVSPNPDDAPYDNNNHIRACVMIKGASAQVVFQSIYRIPPSVIDQSTNLLNGTLTNSTGTLTRSEHSCTALETFGAEITDVTADSLTLIVTGNRPVTLTGIPKTDAMDACVDFIPDAEFTDPCFWP